MEQRAIGPLRASVVGLGCNNFGARVDEEGTAAVVNAALDAGINFFDTADIYGGSKSEEFLGRALAGKRDEAVIATKFGMGAERAGRAPYVRQACEDSLRRLGTDRIDLYQMHRPDPDTPIEETLGVLDELVREGKIRAIGHSNFSADQIGSADDTAAARGWARFVSAQNHYSLLVRDIERDVVPACRERGLGMLPYFPLANGMLTGKYRRGQEPPPGTRLATTPEERRARLLNDRNFDVVEGLERFAAARGRTVLEVAIAWLIAQPSVASVIGGATKPDQVVANAAAADWRMTADEVAEVAAIAP